MDRQIRKLDERIFKFYLNRNVDENGSNFSMGEKQLLSLAKALVRDTKILILDEATSSVDYETDAKIQKTIAREFRQCTIFCIAHRITTILSYDQILILNIGIVRGFDTPSNLHKDWNGLFRKMC